jgi:hypothetical protein
MRGYLLIGALALAGCTASAEQAAQADAKANQDLLKAIGDRVPGAPRDCISASSSDGPQIIDNKTVLYRQAGRVWRNDLVYECPGLEPLKTMIVELHGSQVCRNDQFRTIDPGSHIPGAFCRFGKFTPYDKPKRR